MNENLGLHPITFLPLLRVQNPHKQKKMRQPISHYVKLLAETSYPQVIHYVQEILVDNTLFP